MINYFIFNGQASKDFDLYVGGQNSFNAPKKNATKITVPGKNGDVIYDDGSYKNISISYNIVGMTGFKDKLDAIKDWLLSAKSYARLESSYEPDYYRMGILSSGIDYTMYRLNDTGRAKLTFDCKPQRFLLSGETNQVFTNSGNITNPTLQPARPLIRVYGYGVLSIGSGAVTVQEGFPYVDIDCELQDCYYNTQNANPYVSFIPNKFPVLEPGVNGIAFTENITRVEITPRWWRL